MADDFVWCPMPGAAAEVTHQRVVAQYGDGYSSAIAFGINNRQAKWALSFVGNESKVAPIVQFLDSKSGADSFTWTPPLGVQSNWRANPYSLTAMGAGQYSLNVELVEVFYQ